MRRIFQTQIDSNRWSKKMFSFDSKINAIRMRSLALIVRKSPNDRNENNKLHPIGRIFHVQVKIEWTFTFGWILPNIHHQRSVENIWMKTDTFRDIFHWKKNTNHSIEFQFEFENNTIAQVKYIGLGHKISRIEMKIGWRVRSLIRLCRSGVLICVWYACVCVRCTCRYLQRHRSSSTYSSQSFYRWVNT